MDNLADPSSGKSSAPVNADVDATKSKDGSWLDRPFTLFLLGSVLVSLSGFTFNNYNTCRSTLLKDQQQLARLYREYGKRVESLNILQQHAAEDSAGVIRRAKEALDPNSRFVFQDYKGRTLDDIDFETDYLESKWRINPTAWRAALTKAQATMPNTIEGVDKGDVNVIRHFDVKADFHLYDGLPFQIDHSCVNNVFSGVD